MLIISGCAKNADNNSTVSSSQLSAVSENISSSAESSEKSVISQITSSQESSEDTSAVEPTSQEESTATVSEQTSVSTVVNENSKVESSEESQQTVSYRTYEDLNEEEKSKYDEFFSEDSRYERANSYMKSVLLGNTDPSAHKLDPNDIKKVISDSIKLYPTPTEYDENLTTKEKYNILRSQLYTRDRYIYSSALKIQLPDFETSGGIGKMQFWYEVYDGYKPKKYIEIFGNHNLEIFDTEVDTDGKIIKKDKLYSYYDETDDFRSTYGNW